MVSLMEAYDEISLDRGTNVPPNDMGGNSPESLPSDDSSNLPEPKASLDELQDLARDGQKMTVSHLHTIRSHAHEINSVLDNGVLLDAWMEEKIAIANDYIVHVANALIYRK